jgi:guanylate kinase
MSVDASDAPQRVIVLSGPSGSGKTTIVSELLEKSPVPIEMSISATTRPRRDNEIDGVHYHFLTPERFQELRSQDAFLECAEVHRSGYWYGTLKSEVDRICGQGKWVLLEIDVEGALRIMGLFPAAVSIFLETPSADEYERRLRARGTESEEVIQRRLRTAQEELKSAGSYKHRVVNENLQQAVREICDILAAREVELS